jgi:hypothetical protein
VATKKLLTICASLAGLLLIAAGKAEAQIIWVTANAQAGNPTTAQPSGTYSVPAGQVNDQWQIWCDYGQISGGTFQRWNGVATSFIGITPQGAGGPFNWAQPNAVQLNNPPLGLYVRARLMRKDWLWGWEAKATQYAPVIIPAGPPGGGVDPPGGDDEQELTQLVRPCGGSG